MKHTHSLSLIVLAVVATASWNSMSPAHAQQATVSAAAAKAAEQMKGAFPEKPRLRTRGAPASQTRSGSVIRHRGPVPTLLSADQAAAADAQGSLPAAPSAPPPPPPAIPKSQVDLITTGAAEERVDPHQKIAFDNILFDLDSATVRPSSQEVLRGIAQALQSMPKHRFLVEGHTCDLGDENGPAHNIRLSCLRAEAVCAWLIHFGASPAQLRPMGFGSKEPVQEPNLALSKADNEPLRAPNRRAAFRLLVP